MGRMLQVIDPMRIFSSNKFVRIELMVVAVATELGYLWGIPWDSLDDILNKGNQFFPPPVEEEELHSRGETPSTNDGAWGGAGDGGEYGDMDIEGAMAPELPSRRQPRPNSRLAEYQAVGRGLETNFVNQQLLQVEEEAAGDYAVAMAMEGGSNNGGYLEEYLQHGHLCDASIAELKNRQPGKDGAKEEKLKLPGHLQGLNIQDQPLFPLLCRIALVCSKKSLENATIDLLLKALSDEAASENSCFPPGQHQFIPRTSTELYNIVASGCAPTMYVYEGCNNCGTLKRCENRDSDTCPNCNIAWNFKEKYLSVTEHFRANLNIPCMAELMTHQSQWNSQDGVYQDIYDLSFFKEVMADVEVAAKQVEGRRFQSGEHNLSLWVYGDSINEVKENRGSASVTAVFVGSFNPEAHLRNHLGFSFPAFVSGVTRLDGLLDVLADEIQLLRFVGVPMHDANTQQDVHVHGKLATVFVDSRAFKTFVKLSEPNSIHGCYACKDEGFTLMFGEENAGPSTSAVEPTTVEEPSAAAVASTSKAVPAKSDKNTRRKSKVVYPNAAMALPLTDEGLLLREAFKNLHKEKHDNWNITDEPTARRTSEEIHNAQVLLRDGVITEAAAKEHAVTGYPPLRKTGYNMLCMNYDFMHSVSNVGKLVRGMLLGGEMNVAKTGDKFLAYEHRENNRFRDFNDKDELPWVLTEVEIKRIHERNTAAHNGHMHPDMTGGKLPLAFDLFIPEKKLKKLECEGNHHLFGPYGKYLLDMKNTKLDAGAVGEHDMPLGFTFLEMLFELFDAVNHLKHKIFTDEEAEQTRHNLVKAVAQFHVALPAWYATHATHQLVHLGDRLPCWPMSLDKHERSMRIVRAHLKNHNPQQRDASIMIKFQREYGTVRQLLGADGDLNILARTMYGVDEDLPAGTQYTREGT